MLPEEFARFKDYWRKVSRGRGFTVEAVAREPRDAAIPRVEAAVQAQRGFVLDFKLFSDLSLAMIVELDGPGVAALVDALRALGWPADVSPPRDELAALPAGATVEGTVQVTFPEGKGEHVIPTPAVPG
ncbi:MAG: hypothetical protein QM704_08650 [Anaeromyxobacteraceae bacterium]